MVIWLGAADRELQAPFWCLLAGKSQHKSRRGNSRWCFLEWRAMFSGWRTQIGSSALLLQCEFIQWGNFNTPWKSRFTGLQLIEYWMAGLRADLNFCSWPWWWSPLCECIRISKLFLYGGFLNLIFRNFISEYSMSTFTLGVLAWTFRSWKNSSAMRVFSR